MLHNEVMNIKGGKAHVLKSEMSNLKRYICQNSSSITKQ